MANLVLLVGGGVAAYKAVDLASRLTKAGHRVRAVLSQAAGRFVTPITFEAVTGEPALADLWQPGGGEAHIELARWADAMVMAPATADLIGQLAHGLARDAVGTVALASRGPVVLAPAMHHAMWAHPAVQENVARLKSFGYAFVGPERGRLASGEEGWGRMTEPAEIALAVEALLARRAAPEAGAGAAGASGEAPLAGRGASGRPGAERGRDLAGRRVVVTAGPTQEPLDPIRFLTNRASGRMGFALAEAARDRGADVTLVTGPTALPDPPGVRVVRVRTAVEMRDAVAAAFDGCDAFVAAAAVADYRPARYSERKLKKRPEPMALELVPNPDVLQEMAERKRHQVLVGFAAETEEDVAEARAKLRRKRLDLVVLNDVTKPGAGFDVETNRVTLVSEDSAEALPIMTKREVADAIWDAVVLRLGARRTARAER